MGIAPMRPTFEETFFNLAEVWSRRSTCDRLHTACVFVDDANQVRATGYNGKPRGIPSCDEVGHEIIDGHCMSLHAEVNGVIQAARTGVSILGCTAYTLHRPCLACALVLIQVGIRRVVYRSEYEVHNTLDRVAELFQQAGIEFVRVAANPPAV